MQASRVPLTVVAGEQNRDTPLGAAAAWLAEGTGADLVELPGGHGGSLATRRSSLNWCAASSADLRLLESEVGFEPTTFRLRVEALPSSRCQPGRFSLLTSAGSSIQCVPDLWRYGRGNDSRLGASCSHSTVIAQAAAPRVYSP
jgi:hypothetical protein